MFLDVQVHCQEVRGPSPGLIFRRSGHLRSDKIKKDALITNNFKFVKPVSPRW